MSKLHRRGYLAISTIAAASALFAGAPAGASAAAEEPSSGSTPGGAAVEPPGNSTQPGASDATEWTPQGVDTGTSSGGAAPLEHGSSVGSGMVTGKAGSDSEVPSYTPDSSESYEPEPSVPTTVEEPVSTPRAESAPLSVQPTATETETAAPVRASSAVDDAAVGGAIPLRHSASPQGDGIGSAPPAAAVQARHPSVDQVQGARRDQRRPCRRHGPDRGVAPAVRDQALAPDRGRGAGRRSRGPGRRARDRGGSGLRGDPRRGAPRPQVARRGGCRRRGRRGPRPGGRG